MPLRPVEAEATRDLIDSRPAAKPEYLEWTWVDLWDASAASASNAANGVGKVPEKETVDEAYNEALRKLKTPPT